jgi:hypothetical protein
MLHFVTEFSGKLIMIPQLIDSLLIIIEILIFLFNLVYCNTNNVNHISKNGSSNQLNNHDKKNLNVISWRQVSIANCNDGCYCPIQTVNVLDAPRKFIKMKIIYPIGWPLWCQICCTVEHETKKMSQRNYEHKKLNDSELFFHSVLFSVFDNVSEVNLQLFVLKNCRNKTNYLNHISSISDINNKPDCKQNASHCQENCRRKVFWNVQQKRSLFIIFLLYRKSN